MMLRPARKRVRECRYLTKCRGAAAWLGPSGRGLFPHAAVVALALAFACSPATAEDGPQTGTGAAPATPEFPAVPADAAPEPLDSADLPLPDNDSSKEASEPSAAPPAAGPAIEATQAAPLPAINAALKALLEARAGQPDPHGLLHRREREAIAAFYALRDFTPLWWRKGAPIPEVAAVTERLQRAGDDGLDLRGFSPPGTPQSDTEIANADLALSDAVVAYGRQASGSRVDPHAISRLIGATPEVAEPALILTLTSTAGIDAGKVLQKFNPQQQGYAALREKLGQLRHERAAGIADFRKAGRLPTSDIFPARGSEMSGGASSSRLIAEILANMERWRWMPRELGAERIEVNIPDFEAIVIDRGAELLRTKVVVGKEDTPTPIFSDAMKFLIVNPYWNVPPSILRKEMLPKLANDPNYFSRLGYEVFTRNGHLVVRQPPGERNALGRIKFMFPNDFSVYMHDTPLRKLFAATKRAFSHGCVRVDDPFRFAETVLGPGWSE
ncbi:MAG TPA: L,D-transpeptidase family protein, partial [Methylocella sp.]|nr:L,D-transpeptidase family protein [Methylocella sp.]